jgi:hypothetical protein
MMRAPAPTASAPGRFLPLIGPAMHAALVMGLFVLYVGHVPAVKRTMDEYGVQLPWLTLTVIRISNWLAEYWWATVPPLVVAGVADYVLIRLLARGGRPLLPVLWVAAIGLLLSGVIVVTIYAVEEPLVMLKRGLEK